MTSQSSLIWTDRLSCSRYSDIRGSLTPHLPAVLKA